MCYLIYDVRQPIEKGENPFMNLNVRYICTNLSNLMGIPVRMFENGELTFYHSLVNLVKDPFYLHERDLFRLEGHVAYFVTEDFWNYVVIQNDGTKIIVGPNRTLPITDQELKDLAFKLDVCPDDVEVFIQSMRNIAQIPLNSIIISMLTVNYVINGEMLTLNDIVPFDELGSGTISSLGEKDGASMGSETEKVFNNSLSIEEAVCRLVRHGDLESLNRYVYEAPSINYGLLAKDQLRQVKNTFIVTATLVCRAAIRGGLDSGDAFKLSDSYIQKAETFKDPIGVLTLQFQMILDFTSKVNRLKEGGMPSKLVIDVRNYVIHHLSEAIKTEDIADALFMSRSKLSTKFKEQTGINLCDFVLKEKVKEGKELLHYTQKPISLISAYLGFSSQSHFTRVFSKFEGISPAKYREKHL